MKMQQKLYDGTDFVFELIENILKYADEQHQGNLTDLQTRKANNGSSHASRAGTPGHQPKPSRQPLAWRELLVRRPRLYLRLVLHLDVALCAGVPPEEKDFPPELRRLSPSG